MPVPVQDALDIVDINAAPPPSQPVEKPPHRPATHPAGRAAPPALKARPTDIVAPKIAFVPPPPIMAAPVAGPGAQARAGAAPTPGPGTGAGGLGNGLGAGGDGDGDGGDGDVGPRQLKGRIRNSDYPHAPGALGVGGTVSVRYHVEADGRATGCSIERSSGNAELDAVTCRLIEQRFRFAPARNGDGRPVRSTIVENHSWEIDDSARRDDRPD
jgi:protein TonB